MRVPGLLRWLLLVCASVLGVLALLLVTSLYLLMQPDRFTNMLQEQAHAAGLQLSLSSPASPTLFPRPALQLEGITLVAEHAGRGPSPMPILLAANGRLVLPWGSLFGRRMAIIRMQINSPRVDLDALQAWLFSLPSSSTAVPAEIPRIDTGVRVRNGSLVENNSELLSDVSLDTGRLAPNQTFGITLSGKETDGTPLQFQLSSVPSIDNGSLLLRELKLLAVDSNATSLHLHGQARWNGGSRLNMDLRGSFFQSGQGSYDAGLSLSPPSATQPMLLHMQLLGSTDHIDMSLPPLQLAQWWNALSDAHQPQVKVPPGQGQLQWSKLSLGGVQIEGLSVRTGADVPAPSATVAWPAATSSSAPAAASSVAKAASANSAPQPVPVSTAAMPAAASSISADPSSTDPAFAPASSSTQSQP